MNQESQKPYFNELHVGMELPAAEFGPMDRLDYIPIAIILRDANPLHLDRVYARERGLPDTVQQGPLNQSYLYRFLNAFETLDFYGRLFNMPARERRERSCAQNAGS